MAWHPALGLEVRAMFRGLAGPAWEDSWSRLSWLRASVWGATDPDQWQTPTAPVEARKALHAERVRGGVVARPGRLKKNVLRRKRAMCGKCGMQGHRWCKGKAKAA